ncbi:uncharacterized protein LOC110862807 [Folsomia candida]|uniref:uncharacterized protein LOC110862807 n=1 Tax=Folsomia candida TaxID=158441 RepID=UPI000B8FE0D8|nr:uncharacterized protein LOC110862807 [Folsomia candida]
MEESLLIFAIPAFFVVVCLLFITGNHFYYKFKASKEHRMTGKVSIININNVANSTTPNSNSKSARKHRNRRRSQSPSRSPPANRKEITTMDNFSNISPVVHLNQSDSPPSYNSLFFESDNQLQVPAETFGCNNWLHPNSARTVIRGQENKENLSSNNYAILYL